MEDKTLVSTLWVTMMPTHDKLRDRDTFLMSSSAVNLTKFKQASLKVTSVELQQSALCAYKAYYYINTNVSKYELM